MRLLILSLAIAIAATVDATEVLTPCADGYYRKISYNETVLPEGLFTRKADIISPTSLDLQEICKTPEELTKDSEDLVPYKSSRTYTISARLSGIRGDFRFVKGDSLESVTCKGEPADGVIEDIVVDGLFVRDGYLKVKYVDPKAQQDCGERYMPIDKVARIAKIVDESGEIVATDLTPVVYIEEVPPEERVSSEPAEADASNKTDE